MGVMDMVSNLGILWHFRNRRPPMEYNKVQLNNWNILENDYYSSLPRILFDMWVVQTAE
jgi:hypothetical protein